MDVHEAIRDLCVNSDLTQKLSEAHAQDLFPSKLHFMIESSAACQRSSNIIYWLPHGRAFVFYDQDRLVRELLPLHFNRQHKFASFQRQLNLYGFIKLMGNHVDKGAYYHELFLRGRPELSKLMLPIRHTETDRSTVRRKLDPHSEPNFHQMVPAPPSSDVVASTPMNLLHCQRQTSPAKTTVASATATAGRKRAIDRSQWSTVHTPLLELHGGTLHEVSQPSQSFNEVVLSPVIDTNICTSTCLPPTNDAPLPLSIDPPNLTAGWSTKRDNPIKSHEQHLEDPLQKSLALIASTKVMALAAMTLTPEGILPGECHQLATERGNVEHDGDGDTCSAIALDIEYECDSLC
jgi:HSF-type DNA-binding